MAPDGIRQEVPPLAVAIGAIGDTALLTDLVSELAVRVDELTVRCVCIYLHTQLCIFYNFSEWDKQAEILYISTYMLPLIKAIIT